MKKTIKIALAGIIVLGALAASAPVAYKKIEARRQDNLQQQELISREEAFYREHKIRQAKPGEFSLKIYSEKDFVLPDSPILRGGRFNWIDKDTVAFGPRPDEELLADGYKSSTLEAMKSAYGEPFYILFNLKTLDKRQVKEWPQPAPEAFLLLDQDAIDKNRVTILEKNLYIQDKKFSYPVQGGFLSPSWEGTIGDALIGGPFSINIGAGLHFVSPNETIEVLKGHIWYLQSSPDGCRAIFLWRKAKLYEDMNYKSSSHLTVLDLCNKPPQGE